MHSPQKLLERWQRRLLLQHWTITLRVLPFSEMDGTVGRTFHEFSHHTAEIQLADPATLPTDLLLGYTDLKSTLVHELLHLVVMPLASKLRKGAASEEALEQTIEHLRKALMK